MPIKKILSKNDLIEIAEFFVEKNYGDNIHIEIELPDQKTMNRVNEDFYYKLKINEKNGEDSLEEIDELNINVGGVKFRYFIKEK